MPSPEWLAEQFEQHRAHLRAVAYRMLGSASEADDAVQDSWIRLGRTDVGDVQNLRAWLTTVSRVCAWICCGCGHRGERTRWTRTYPIP
jgi:RNA polymerase sigma-70 factor, ECF subfamily